MNLSCHLTASCGGGLAWTGQVLADTLFPLLAVLLDVTPPCPPLLAKQPGCLKLSKRSLPAELADTAYTRTKPTKRLIVKEYD